MSEAKKPNTAPPQGGGFLLDRVGDRPVFTPEDFTKEQRELAETCRKFSYEEVLPRNAEIEALNPKLMVELLRKAADLGLLMIDIPEQYGGLGLDKVSSLIAAEWMSKNQSFSVSIGAHTGIGTVPILYFGTPDQKAKYLPKLATGELLSCYALTETGSGSDALGMKTKATLSSDGGAYLLNGSKQFITNAGFAGLFIVFAKVNGEKVTGFIVEKDTRGFTVGPEEKKMGLKGSSTRPLVFEDAPVPKDRVLGEIGKGHKIAFNTLNVGRLKLGVGSTGTAKHALEFSIRYAKDRKQFGKTLSEFGLIRKKLAEMTARIFAGESLGYRAGGLVDALSHDIPAGAPDAEARKVAALEEYAIEASISKVYGTEALAFCADEAVQIHGGYGFTQEFPAERIYRDCRVERIFEGTNEINRLFIPGTLLRRATQGKLALLDAAQKVTADVRAGRAPALPKGPLEVERAAVERAKAAALFTLSLSAERFGMNLGTEEEVLEGIADQILQAFALESAVARAVQQTARGGGDGTTVMTHIVRLVAHQALEEIRRAARFTAAASADDATRSTVVAAIDKLLDLPPADVVASRKVVADAVLEKGGYPL